MVVIFCNMFDVTVPKAHLRTDWYFFDRVSGTFNIKNRECWFVGIISTASNTNKPIIQLRFCMISGLTEAIETVDHKRINATR